MIGLILRLVNVALLNSYLPDVLPRPLQNHFFVLLQNTTQLGS